MYMYLPFTFYARFTFQAGPYCKTALLKLYCYECYTVWICSNAWIKMIYIQRALIAIDVFFSFHLLVTSYNFISNNGSFEPGAIIFVFKPAYITYHVKHVTKRNMNICSLCSSGFCVTHYFIWKGVVHQLPATHTYNMYMHYINRKESLPSITNFRWQQTLSSWIYQYWGYMSDYRHYKNFDVSWLCMYVIHHKRDDFSTDFIGTNLMYKQTRCF